jgi:environmental stress-induced protein Ves
MRVRRAGDYKVMPWKNGGGTTTEVAISPPGATLGGFDWRISMATIERDGPFSSFPDIDRTLTLLDGKRLDLTIDNAAPVVLTPEAPTLSFGGESQAAAAVPAGPITDFNVMSRRGGWRHRFEQMRLTSQLALPIRGDAEFVFLADGNALRCRPQNGEPVLLGRRDSMILEAGDPLDWIYDPIGAATVFFVTFSR